MSIIGKIRDKIPLKGLIKWALAFAPLAIVGGQWWGKGGYRNYKEILLDKKIRNIEVTIPDDSLPNFVDDAQKYYRYITLVYAYKPSTDKDGQLNINLSIFSEPAKEFIGNEFDRVKVLDFIELKTGLKAILTKNNETNEKILAICGAQTKPKEKFEEDFFDAFYSSSGMLTEQFPELYKFVHDCQNKFGKIDVVAGHSLGGHHATSLTPELKEARVFAYDSPGLTHNQLFQIRKFYRENLNQEVSKKDIKDKFRDGRYVRVIVGNNCYNAIGTGGITLSMTDPKNDDYSPFNPTEALEEDHFHNTTSQESYSAHIFKAKDQIKFYNADQRTYSGAPLGATAVLALIPLSLFLVPKIKRKFESELAKYEDRNPPTPDSTLTQATSIRLPYHNYPLPQYNNHKLGFNGHNNRTMHK